MRDKSNPARLVRPSDALMPAGFLLARVYEKTDSIWTGIFLHMTVNGVSMLIVSALGAYL